MQLKIKVSPNLVHVVADELHGLFERVGVAAARVYHHRAERYVRQQSIVLVNLIDCVEHRLEPLNSLLLLDRTARIFTVGALMLVHRKDSAQHNVAGYSDELSIVAVAAAAAARID